MWFSLYTRMALSLGVLNRAPAAPGTSLKLIVVLIAFCLVWPFYAFSETSRLPGLLGNIGVLLLAEPPPSGSCGRFPVRRPS